MVTPLLPPKYDHPGSENIRPFLVMNGLSPATEPSGPSFEELHKKFREFKHATNNALAIMMALGEMTARNPDHAKRLVEIVGQKGPQITGQLQELDEWFKNRATLNELGK